jgi:hypothetical protein
MALLSAAVIDLAAGVHAQGDTSPPSAPPRGMAGTPSLGEAGRGQDVVLAVVVHSWSGCSSDLVIWDELNADWSSYGSIPIHIDYDYPGLCDGPITYDALVASGADVVILSDPAGGTAQFSASEVAAIQQYANDGHNVVGSYLVFFYANIDNRALAPIFGLDPGVEFLTEEHAATATYRLSRPNAPLFDDIRHPYVSEGYPYSQTPADGIWSLNEAAGSTYVAMNQLRDATILVYRTQNYVASYISSMPEYQGGTKDLQYYYNAITFGP